MTVFLIIMVDYDNRLEIRVHSKVDRFATLRNLYSKNDTWVTMMVVGPFYKHTHAMTFFQL